MIDYIKRAFYKPNWKLAYRERKEENSDNLIFETKREYTTLKIEENYWYADPFAISDSGKVYVFCECFLKGKQKGVIAAGEYKNGKLNHMKIVIEQNFHMSYPCVFKYCSEYYMIPETSANKTIELYKAKKFPYEWELINILKKDIKIVDTTVFILNDEFFLIGYKPQKNKNKICLYKLNMDSKTIDLITETEDDDRGRPAGNIFYSNENIIRPAQVSTKKYGESIVFKNIISINNNDYHEEELCLLEGKDVSINGEEKIHRIHTINIAENFEIIDYSCDSLDIFKPFKILLSKLLLY